jgi:hypothetical protein
MAYSQNIHVTRQDLEARNDLAIKTGISVRDVTKETLNVLVLNIIV